MSMIKLFLTFIKIGFISFGGGYGMILVMKDELIKKRMTNDKKFMDALVIAQSSPGPLAVNLAITVGHSLKGVTGSIFAFTGVVLPSFFIILVLSGIFYRIKDNRYVKLFMEGTKPAVLALIIMSLVNLLKSFDRSLINIALIILTAALTIFLKLHPIMVMLIVGIIKLAVKENKKYQT